MKIDDKTVEKLAELSKLEFQGEAKETIKNDLNKILSFVDKLNEVDTEGVAPLKYMTEGVNVLRADDVEVTITHEEALKNSPVKDSDYFKVPKVLEK